MGPTTPVVPLLTYGLPTRLGSTADGEVYLCAGVAVRVHPRGTDPAGLAATLTALRTPDLEPVWVQPLGYRPLALPDGRLATVWPRVSVLSTLDRPPWQDAGRLLARLHRAGLPADPPPRAEPHPLTAALAVLRSGDHALAGLGDRLAAELAQRPATGWVHGDFHLGRLAQTALRRRWKLFGTEHLGPGDPGWDLARPAAFHAAGLLAPGSWEEFLDGYRAAAGTAVPEAGDPWPALEVPARAAALAVAVPLLHQDDARATAEALLAVARGGVAVH